MYRILGVDPGSNCTGFGLVAGEGGEVCYVASGTIAPPRSATRYERLCQVFDGIVSVIREHQPTHFAIEEVFYSKNPRSALVLGEARGVAILAAAKVDLPVFEYAAREVKMSVTGNGAAHKSQVNFMLGKLLNITPPANADESDALAVAMCHAFRNREWSAV